MADANRPITLKVLSSYLGLSPTTISMVLNKAPGAQTIAPATQQRVRKAAARLGYHPNLHARMLGMRVRGSGGGRGEGSGMSLKEQARRLEELEQETAKLKRIVDELCSKTC
jgi:hypothetical protein